jgi:recombination protein RecT
MTRTSQLLHPQRDPAPTRPAATVLLLRDGPAGLEVLMTRRSLTASFAPGAYVFPGGGVDPLDAASHALATRRPGQSDLHLTQAIAAIRESFEELGVLLAQHADGRAADQQDIAALDRSQPFAAQCQARGLQLAAHDVFVLAHWVWVRPAEALARHEAGQFFIIFPTIRTLERLQGYANVDAVLQACAATEEPLWTSCPRAGLLAGREARYMEHEHPYGELALVCPDGQLVHSLDWQCEQPVPLLKNLQRLTAPNPGVMTGPGTNSYLVGDPHTGYIAIDPGPADPAHLERLWRAAGGDIRMIVCTHSHPDHSPGARPLQALCQPQPPILGLPSAPTARENSRFSPDRLLQNKELLTLTGQGLAADLTHTLMVIHTPGHAANHLCLLLLEDGLLFSGDHILNGSTTVIDPPDGDMSAYLDSLDRLADACEQHSIDFILPAHGYAIGDAAAAIAHLKAHRLRREAKILAVMQAHPEGTPDDWVARAYDDVPPRLWPVAKRSLLAHVARIEASLS